MIAILLPERAMPPAVIWLTICGRVLSCSVNTVPFGTDAHMSLNVKRNTVKVAGFIIGSTIAKIYGRNSAPSIFAASSSASGKYPSIYCLIRNTPSVPAIGGKRYTQ